MGYLMYDGRDTDNVCDSTSIGVGIHKGPWVQILNNKYFWEMGEWMSYLGFCWIFNTLLRILPEDDISFLQ
jgi:hypothetical protein